MNLKFRDLFFSVLVPTLAGLLSSAGHAQSYPNRAVSLIVPFAPAGPIDIIGRLVADQLSQKWGAPVVVSNYAGAGGNIGTRRCAESAPDGYTICIQSVAQTIAPAFYADPGYDPVKDFAHVARVATLPSVLVVHPSLPVHNVKELIALAKSKPGVLNYASGGKGTSTYMLTEWFKHEAGINLVQIPYKGSGPALMDQISGRIAVAFYTVIAVLPYIKEGKLSAIAVSTKNRLDLLPDVPTIDESGVKGFDGGSWAGVVMPAGVPRDIVSKVNADLAEILESPTMKQKIRELGGLTAYEAPDRFTAFVAKEVARWARVAKEADAHGK